MPENTENIEKTSYEEALDKVESLYSSPLILAKAAVIIRDPNVQLDDIEQLIKVDAALTADLIKMSNSPAYNFGDRVSNLSGAIKRVGFGRVTRLIGLSAANAMAQSDLKHYGITQQEYWEDSVSMAIIMEILAAYGGLNPADAYTIGLLHGIGKIVLNEIMDTYELSSEWDKTKPVEEWEKEVIGFNYAYAGAMILKRWGFPATTCHPILYQLHLPKEKIPWKLHSCICAARTIIGITGVGFKDEEADLEGAHGAIAPLGIDPGSLGEIMDMARQNYGDIKNTVVD